MIIEHRVLGKPSIHPRDHVKMSSLSWRGKLDRNFRTVQSMVSKDSTALSCSDWLLEGDDEPFYQFNKAVLLLTRSLVEHYILKNLILKFFIAF